MVRVVPTATPKEPRRYGGVRPHRRHHSRSRARGDEICVAVVGEPGLYRFQVQKRKGSSARGGGQAGADQGLAHRRVRAPYAKRGGLKTHVACRQHRSRGARAEAVPPTICGARKRKSAQPIGGSEDRNVEGTRGAEASPRP
eukprot:CAMPEP_0119214656 /NCGR_PEP_ID=MMETSP1327-20130426/10033_1 /TAXON_ID=38833 /ORGANISM="Micromonas pusilla, Strain RCC2306" /LENGTH=141 /DNA_ID=CAMNT_0007212403 /DNA_START=789 /DNA_END=1214 /DNA_ORIENTATION=-